MTSGYSDKHYLHPLAYVMWFSTIGWLLHNVLRGDGPSPFLSAAGLTAAAFGMVLVGRAHIKVDERVVTVSYGWLALLKKTLELDRVERVEVCLDTSVMTKRGMVHWYSFRPSRRILTKARRGVRISCSGRRWFVPSRNPASLKSAIIRRNDWIEEAPDYRQFGPLPATPGRSQRRPFLLPIT